MAKKGKGKKLINNIALILLSVGGINWIFTKLFDFDLVAQISTAIKMPMVGTLIYSLVGIAGVYVGVMALMGKVEID